MDQRGLRVRGKGPLTYLLRTPVKPAAQGRPLLCFLHGYDEGAPTPIDAALTRHGPLRAGAAERGYEFIVVAPQLPRRGDFWHRYADAVQEIVLAEQKANDADADALCLTGFSFGGNGVFDLALSQAGFWSALWPVDPTRVPAEDPRGPVFLSFGEVARMRKHEFVQSLKLEPAARDPHGERLYIDDGADHVGAATQAYADERIYDWLLSKSRRTP